MGIPYKINKIWFFKEEMKLATKKIWVVKKIEIVEG